MSKTIELILLLIVKKNGTINSVLAQGYTYSQVSRFIGTLEKIGYIIFENKALSITESGSARILSLQKDLASTYSGWILPELKSKIDSIPVNSVYLPNTKKRLKLEQILVSSSPELHD